MPLYSPLVLYFVFSLMHSVEKEKAKAGIRNRVETNCEIVSSCVYDHTRSIVMRYVFTRQSLKLD